MSMGETKCAHTTVHTSHSKKRKNKNYKEDDESRQVHWLRKSITSNSEFSENKSQISEGRRIDLDSDFESQYDFNSKSNLISLK
jgi:hypothetical protein